MKKLTLLFIVATTFFIHKPYSYAHQYPQADIDEVIVLTLDEIQSDSMIKKINFGTKKSPKGVCYGIDRVNYALLTNLFFEEGTLESDESIEFKLLDTFYNQSDHIISGFEDAKDFISQMEARWDEETNPLKRAIDEVQLSQNLLGRAYENISHKVEHLMDGKATFSTEARTLEYHLIHKTPVKIGIMDSEGSHALTVVGFKRKLNESWGKLVTEFLVLDSNYPRWFEVLELTDQGWFYKDWQYEKDKGFVFLVIEEPNKDQIKLAQRKFDLHFIYHPDLEQITEEQNDLLLVGNKRRDRSSDASWLGSAAKGP